METDSILAVCGILGGLLTAAGDLLLDLKGKDNVTGGKYGFLDSAWDQMDIRRFQYSILLAMVGVPLIYLGLIAMSGELMKGSRAFGEAFFYISTLGASGGFFIHTIICLFPVIYKTMVKSHSPQEAEGIINAVYESIRIPFWIQYICFVILPSLMIITAICTGWLGLSGWYILLTLPVLMGVSLILRKVRPQWFCDLPGIIAPSLSMSMIGLLALLNGL